MKRLVLMVLSLTTSLLTLADNERSLDFLMGSADKYLKGAPGLGGEGRSSGVRGSVLLDKNLELEITYVNFGSKEARLQDEYGDFNTTESTTALSFGLKKVLPIDSSISIVGRLGLSDWRYKVDSESFVSSDAYRFSGVDVYYGLGGEYKINEKISLGLEYNYTLMKVFSYGKSIDYEVKNMMLSASCHF